MQEGLPVSAEGGEARIRADHLLAYRARRADQRRRALAEVVAEQDDDHGDRPAVGALPEPAADAA
jgi:hypothetical protein